MARPFSGIQIWNSFLTIIPYFGVTLGVVLGTVLLGLLLAILLFVWKLSHRRFLNRLSDVYINIIRCTPSIVLLFIVYYGIPKLFLGLFNADLNFAPKIIYVIISLSLIYSASLAEIMRSVYLAMGKAQYEAALSVGLSPFQAVFRIMLPQGLVIALPNLGNSLIALFKEGSLAFTIGLIDMMGQGNLIISRNYGAYSLETYIALAIIYWALTLIIEEIFHQLEKKLSPQKSAAGGKA
ncbi:MAG: amino acid ABC transporter permease [Treponema sp.]|nr:amino acid ABC transporter permease [Treponema sp.]